MTTNLTAEALMPGALDQAEVLERVPDIGAHDRDEAVRDLLAILKAGLRGVESPDLMDGGVTAALIEKEAEQAADCGVELGEYICTREKGHSGHHIAATVALHHSVAAAWDSQPRVDWEAVAKFEEKRAEQAEERAGEAHDAIVALRNDVALMEDRALNAEKERDEARRHECSDLDAHWRLGEALASLKEANATVASLRAEQPRALTPDAITDSHVLSARLKANALGWFGRFDAPAEEWRQVLTAALTEPPSRPEWEDAPYVWADSAQGGGRVIWKRSTSDDGRVIWSSGGTWHPSWMLTNPAPVVPEGVRVVTEKEARHATDE